MYETVSPSGTLEMTYTEIKERSPSRHRKILFKSLWWRFFRSASDRRIYFERKVLKCDGNWKFWILITRLSLRWVELSSSDGFVEGKRQCWVISFHFILPKTQLAYIENNRRYVNFRMFFSCGAFNSMFCHESINSGCEQTVVARTEIHMTTIARFIARLHWAGSGPIEMLFISNYLHSPRCSSYETWIIPTSPKETQTWT